MRPFREIQTTAHGETLVGRSNKIPQKSPKKGKGNVQEKEQNKPLEIINRENVKQNSNEKDEDHEFMVNGIIPNNYWEKLAEERRIALAEVLDENEQLCELVNKLRSDLKKMVGRANLFEQWVKELLEETDDDTEEKDDS